MTTELVEGKWTFGAVKTRLNSVGGFEEIPVANQSSSPVANPVATVSPVVGAAVNGSGDKVSKMVGKICAGVSVVVITSSLEKPDRKAPNGYIVEELDQGDISDLESSIAESFKAKFPDANVPWWLGISFAMGNLYLGGRNTRAKREYALPVSATVSSVEVDKVDSSEDTDELPKVHSPIKPMESGGL